MIVKRVCLECNIPQRTETAVRCGRPRSVWPDLKDSWRGFCERGNEPSGSIKCGDFFFLTEELLASQKKTILVGRVVQLLLKIRYFNLKK